MKTTTTPATPDFWERLAIDKVKTGELPKPAPFVPPWKGMHPNSRAYAETFAAYLRKCCRDEAEAAEVYRDIRAREIPARPAAALAH